MRNRKEVAPRSDPETRAFIASLGLVEWEAALAAAKQLLVALDAPPVSPEALERLQKLIRYRGEQHATLVIRTIIESEGNELALVEPVISAVSQVMSRRPEWPDRGLAWIAAFDAIPLLQIVETMRGLEIFREESIGTYLAASLESRLAKFLPDTPAPEVTKPGPKPPRSETRVPENMAKVKLGLELAAIRDKTPNNRKFGELARAKCDLPASIVSDLIRVARRYGEREEITSRLSWAALVVLSGASPKAREAMEDRILAGEAISKAHILAAETDNSSTKSKPAAKRATERVRRGGRKRSPRASDCFLGDGIKWLNMRP
jgi:hypothetical protein